ncbi:transposase [Streptomyces sparsogenes]|uniref:transposase n=1 Tax=Streptomyces sparsogenes TaxID=67365 RepID=UPI0033F13341
MTLRAGGACRHRPLARPSGHAGLRPRACCLGSDRWSDVSLTDARWARVEPLLPDGTPMRGGRWRDHREVIDTIAFTLQTGTQWVHLSATAGLFLWSAR